MHRAHPLRDLGLHGLDHLDAVLVAALADETPLLLIGQHGSAKSALLERTAQALGLDHRHYNSSPVSFDDLLGASRSSGRSGTATRRSCASAACRAAPAPIRCR